MKKIELTFIILLLFGLITISGFAQEKKEKKPGPAKKPAATATQGEKGEEQDIDTHEFVYKPNGRRDPFKSLMQGKEGGPERTALEGIAGLTIGELSLEGIVGYGDGTYRALFKCPKNRPYTVSVGDKVYDGEVYQITANSVVFKQILTVALGGTKERYVTKYLNPEEETGKKDKDNNGGF